MEISVSQVLVACALVHATTVTADWDAAYSAWNESWAKCTEEELISYMPPVCEAPQVQLDESIHQWSKGMHEWIDIMAETGPCLPDNATDVLNNLRALVDAVRHSDPFDIDQASLTAAHSAYFLWAEILFVAGHGDLIVAPGYRENSTISEELTDIQDVMRISFNLWKDHGSCRELDMSQCEQPINLNLTSDDAVTYLSLCGNQVTEDPEECDDGNHISGDGCSSNCTVENCPIPPDPSSTTSPDIHTSIASETGDVSEITLMPTQIYSSSVKGEETISSFVPLLETHTFSEIGAVSEIKLKPTQIYYSSSLKGEVTVSSFVPPIIFTDNSIPYPKTSTVGPTSTSMVGPTSTPTLAIIIDYYTSPKTRTVGPTSTRTLDVDTVIPASLDLRYDTVTPASLDFRNDYILPPTSTVRPTPTSTLDFKKYFSSIPESLDLRDDYILPTSIISTQSIPSGLNKRSLPDPAGPLQEFRPKRVSFLNLCPDDCDTLNTTKAGSTRLTNFALRGSQRLVNPGTIKDMKRGLALMAMVMQTLGRHVPRLGTLIKLQGKMAKAVLDRLGNIEAALIRAEGAAIWVRLTAHCCQSIRCCLVTSRHAWRPVHNWYKCLKPDGLGFDAGDGTIGANIVACTKAALRKKFNCNPGPPVIINLAG